MSEIQLSARAKAVLSWIQNQKTTSLAIRQASLAEELGCSRWSIGRALRRLKEAGFIEDLNKRDNKSRCKIYGCPVELKKEGLERCRVEMTNMNRHCEEPQATWQSKDPGLLRYARNDENESFQMPTALTVQAERQLSLYRQTFESVFRDWPDWQKHYVVVTWGLEHVTDIDDLWRQTFDGLYTMESIRSPYSQI